MQDTGDIIQATLGEPQIGGDGDDLLIGDDRANVLEGGNGVDTLVGLGGDDTIVGNKGDDRMLGGAGDDLLVWNNGDGSDIMTGDAGEDRTQVNFNTDLVEDDLQNDDTARIETNGVRTEFARTEVNGQTERGLFALNIDGVETLEVNFGGGNDTAELVGELSREVDIELDGGEGEDELDLSELSSGVRVVLDASGGDDQNGFVVTGPVRVDARDFENVVGTDFDDKVRGSKEDNVISGGDGADTLRGLRGDDTIVGNKGDDRMIGGAGDDLLVWNNGDGSDLMKGGRGDDRTQVNFDTDLVNDDLQNDDTARIESAGQNFRFARTEVNGQSERGLFELDIRFVETLEVNFGGGDDTAELVGVPSRRLTTELDGGEGEDTLDLSDVDRAAVVDIGAGLASVERGGDVVFEGFENVIGTDFADEIVGDGGANLIASGSANDEIEGGDGDDTLLGNLGDDEVFGGEGDDLLIWNNGDGSDLLNGGEGDDRVQVNFQQNTDLSQLDLQNDDVATIADDGEGGITFNRVEVNGQSERGLFQLDIEESETLEVNFGGGNDVARVLGLADLNIALQLDGGAGVDTIDFSGLDLDGEEEGVVFDAASGEIETVAGDASDDVAVGFENIVGTAGDDVISGDDQDNVIEGGGGSDILSGGAGADTFVFGDEPGVTVILDFEVGQDRIAFRSESFGVEEPLALQTVARDGEGTDAALVDVEGGSNLYVLQGGFENAGQAADALADALTGGDDEGAGFFVYFNVNQERARLVSVDDLDDAAADIAVLANLGEGGTPEAIETLDDFTADNFAFIEADPFLI